MTTATKTEKAPLVLDAHIQTEYASVLFAKENSNTANFAFLALVAKSLTSKTLTQAVIEDSIKAESKGATIQAEFKSAHVKSAVIAQAIVEQIPSVKDSPIAKVLTMANRVLDDKKAKGALAHIKQFKTMEELDENTLTKAESQARDKGESLSNEIAEKKENITIESVLDGFVQFFNGKNLQDLSTKDLESAKKAFNICLAIVKNSEKVA
jgi:hypothetical protein